MNFLACDLGGTKVLLGIFKKDANTCTPNLIFKKKYISSEWDSIDTILEDFLKNECKNINHPFSACFCLLYTSPSPRDRTRSRMPSSA